MTIHGACWVGVVWVGLRLRSPRATMASGSVARVFPARIGDHSLAGQARSSRESRAGAGHRADRQRIFQVLAVPRAGRAVGIDSRLVHAFAVRG